MKWKLVPEEPTLDMIGMAGIARMQHWRNGEGAIVRPIWEAMLAAAPQPDMTPPEKIDAALDLVLPAGKFLKTNYSSSQELDRMRDAMRKIMSESYIQGSRDAQDAMKSSANTGNHPRIGRDKQ